MKDKLTDSLTREIIEMIRDTKTFVVSQSPDVVQQLLRYEMVKSIFFIIITFILCVISCRLTLVFKKDLNEANNTDIIFCFYSAGAAVFTACVFTNYLLALIQIIIAPKVYLLKALT